MAIFGNRVSRPVQWLNMAGTQARRVGKVLNNDRPVGTGILCDGRTFGEALDGLPLFLSVPHAAQLDQSTPEYFSVFISYSHADAAFANRLYNALQASGIRAWLDRKNMLPGDDIYEEVHKGIQQWDKVLLCCSKSSLSSWWVDSEIDRAFQKERDLWKERQRRVNALIPLDLDGYLLDGWDSGKAQNVRARLAADFRGWQDDRAFEASVEHLRLALRADAGAREKPPASRL